MAESGVLRVRVAGAWWRVASVVALVLALLMAAAGSPGPVGATPRMVTNGDDSGPGSLRATFAAAASGDTIVFDEGVDTVTLTSAAITLNKDITIQGRGFGGVTIQRSAANGTPNFRVFLNFNSEVDATLQGLTIAQGHIPAGASGGGIANFDGRLTLIDSVVRSNVAVASGGAGGEGGGIYQEGGSLTLDNSYVSLNSADGHGGGIYITSADLTLLNGATIGGNNTDRDGGGIYSNLGTVTAVGAIIGDNTAGGNGGGIYKNNGTLTVTDSTISGNIAPSNGGGLYSNYASTTFSGSLFTRNSAFFGGAIFAYDNETLSLTNSTISGNIADTAGGVYNVRGLLLLTFSTVLEGITGSSEGDSENPSETLYSRSIILGGCSGDFATFYASAGYNIVRAESGCPLETTFGDLGYDGPLDALISPLGFNGGPTQTNALPLNSPALNRVPVDQCGAANGLDQRDVDRPQGPGCDSGAFELNYYTLIVGPPPILFELPMGTVVTLAPTPDVGSTFIGWAVDGVNKGWANPLTITMGDNHTVQATFVPTKLFTADVPDHPNAEAITELASRGNILGYDSTHYGPSDPVERAQMAVLIARATPFGPGSPTNGTLTPPGCTVAGTWDCEDWGTSFTDRGGVPASLWRAAGTLQHYGVAFGYTQQDCANQNRAFPCYGPTDRVSYAQTIAFIARAMIAKGYWVAQPDAQLPSGNVPGVLATPIRTFAYYTGGIPAAPADWNAGAARGWFAEALWAALDSYWGTDGLLPDGRPAGGMVP